MKPAHLSYGFLVSFLVTTLAGRWVHLIARDDVSTAFAVIGAMTALAAFIRHFRSTAIIVSAILFGASLGSFTVIRAEQSLEEFSILSFANDARNVVIGQIDEIPDHRPSHTRYVVRATSVDGTAAMGRLLVYDSQGFPEYEYGDMVRVSGKIRAPEPFDDFDYPKYLRTQKIDVLMGFATVEAAEPIALTMKQRIFRSLYRFREAVEDRIQLLLTEPHASLLIGFITGSRSGLPDRINEQFRITGTSHIVAVSGYNVTLVLAIASSFLFWLPMRRRFFPLTIGILLYMLLTGAGAPVVRASIMGFLGLLALQLERRSIPRLSLLWAAFAMTMIDPIDLWYDPGFQMSFLSVLGITELSPLLHRIFRKIPRTLGIRESLIATVAAQIATLPVSALTFGQLSLISPATNVLIAPMIPISMALGGLAILMSLIAMPLGLLIAYPTWAALTWILEIVEFTAAIPWASLQW